MSRMKGTALSHCVTVYSRRLAPVLWFHGVVGSTQDFESCNRSSSLRETSFWGFPARRHGFALLFLHAHTALHLNLPGGLFIRCPVLAAFLVPGLDVLVLKKPEHPLKSLIVRLLIVFLGSGLSDKNVVCWIRSGCYPIHECMACRVVNVQTDIWVRFLQG